MYINFWYPACLSEELTADKPLYVQMLGCAFVAFRDSAGQAHVLSNICVHRGASLAHGKVKGDAIECPYHGWQFQGSDGVCSKIPSLGKDGKIPARAKVDSYPVQEKYGLVFAFLGDLPEAERPPLMDIPEWGQDGWAITRMNNTWKANYLRSQENTLDPAHTEFVHPSMGYQGGREDYNVPDLKVIERDWGVGTMTTFVSPDLPSAAMKGVKGEGGMEAGAGHHGPAHTWTYLHFSPKAHAHQYSFKRPIDRFNFQSYFIQFRNFKTEAAVDAPMYERSLAVAEQDRVVVERLAPVLTPASSTEEVMVKADLVITKFRERLQEWEDKGWRIDVDKMDALKDKKMFSIPSPARRTTKGWALDPVPLLPAKGAALGERRAAE
ncbi:MAG: aromatic ring-hydroxylating dioxygenase subunit alpha [Rhodospirillaceae bacterium]|nr:aromatic ring-hydroxylating dioxygenase subunit alpha [Rhodospirillaceae bacterium]